MLVEDRKFVLIDGSHTQLASSFDRPELNRIATKIIDNPKKYPYVAPLRVYVLFKDNGVKSEAIKEIKKRKKKDPRPIWAQRIEKKRKEQGIGVYAAAANIKMKRDTYALAEKEGILPNAKQRKKIADYYNLSISDLFKGALYEAKIIGGSKDD